MPITENKKTTKTSVRNKFQQNSATALSQMTTTKIIFNMQLFKSFAMLFSQLTSKRVNSYHS